jgi:uncharacterized protein (TIGR03437 family)
VKVFIRPNKYEPGRAHIAIYNWDLKPSVPVDLTDVVASGSTYEIRDVQNWFGEPVVRGTYNGGSVDIPMNLTSVTSLVGEVDHFDHSTHTGPRFGAFVVLSALPSTPPAVASGGVLNAAGPGNTTGAAPGSLISIYGQNLTDGRTEMASGVPWPFALAGTQVRIDGQLVPVFYASPDQINVQVPNDVPAGRDVDVQVIVGDRIANPEHLTVVDTAPGLFGIIGEGARPGEVLAIFGTGLGPVSPEVPSGYAAPTDTLSVTLVEPEVLVGGRPAKVTFSGLAPTLVGVNQVNAIVPSDLPPGPAEVVLRVGDRTSNSNLVTIGSW